MATRSAFARRRQRRGDQKFVKTEEFSYSGGINRVRTNDEVESNQFVYGTDARTEKLGRWETRRGSDRFSVPVGEAGSAGEVSIAGAGAFSLDYTNRIAQRVTGITRPITRADINIFNITSATGVVYVTIHADDGGAPGDVIAESSIATFDISNAAAYVPCYFMQAPTPTGDVWLVAHVQEYGTNTYSITTTTNAPNASVSTDFGQTWAPAGVSINYNLFTADPGGIKGRPFTVKRPNGAVHTFFAHDTSVYQVNQATGAVTTIDTGRPAAAEYYDFEFVNDTLFYANGQEKLRQYDFTTASEVADCPVNVSLCKQHKGVMFVVNADDPAQLFASEFANYDEYLTSDFTYVDAPKTGDPITALAKLNGVLVTFTRKNKFILYGNQRANFNLDEAPGQKGTFSQSSISVERNFVYFASDDNIYRFDGTEDTPIGTSFLPDWTSLLEKGNTAVVTHNNRLHVYYTPVGEVDNTQAFVYNTLFQLFESIDLTTMVSGAFAKETVDDIFYQGSNRVGAVYKGELSTNDNHTLGAPLTFELRTKYETWGAPAQLKDVRKLRPRFLSSANQYEVEVLFSADEVETEQKLLNFDGGPVLLQSEALGWDSTNTQWDGTNQWDLGGGTIKRPHLEMPGEYYSIQTRYRHKGAREPVTYLGTTTDTHYMGLR